MDELYKMLAFYLPVADNYCEPIFYDNSIVKNYRKAKYYVFNQPFMSEITGKSNTFNIPSYNKFIEMFYHTFVVTPSVSVVMVNRINFSNNKKYLLPPTDFIDGFYKVIISWKTFWVVIAENQMDDNIFQEIINRSMNCKHYKNSALELMNPLILTKPELYNTYKDVQIYSSQDWL